MAVPGLPLVNLSDCPPPGHRASVKAPSINADPAQKGPGLPPAGESASLPRMLRITDTVSLADWELVETFTRASGPGGQNVNKVSTAVELRFWAEASPHLDPGTKARLRRLAGRKWGEDGSILIRAEEMRSQAQNRERARERLAEMIRKALVAPKRRIPTKPTAGSQRRRLTAKAVRGTVKALRAAPGDEE